MQHFLVKISAFACCLSLCLPAMTQDFDHHRNGEPVFDTARANALARDARLAYQQAYKTAWETWIVGQSTKMAAPKKIPKKTERGPSRFGTIQYDDGVVSGAAASPLSFTHGNHFSTADGLPLLSCGSVTAVSFYMVSVQGSNAFISIFGPLNGTTAALRTSILQTGLVAGAFNTLVFSSPISLIGGNFLAGVWLNPGTDRDVLGLGGGTFNSQGFHGMVINDIEGTNFMTVPNVNYIFRATTNGLCPVELINFEIE